MFQDPNSPDVQTLAQHHDAGTHDQITPEQAMSVLEDFHANVDPKLAKQVVDAHYEQMSSDQLVQAAQQFHQKLAGIVTKSDESRQLEAIDPATATWQQVAEMHLYLLEKHADLMREIVIGSAVGASTIAVGALAAFAARRYLSHHGK